MANDISGFWEILKITLPALIVFITAYFLFRDMLENAQRQREFESKIENLKQVTPVRLQAYERLTLFLERISPESLLVRQNSPSMTVSEFHNSLLSIIRQEYEHNISQQIYISPLLWENIKGAKENLITLINRSVEEVDNSAPSVELSQQIFNNYMNQEHGTIHTALKELKKEAARLF